MGESCAKLYPKKICTHKSLFSKYFLVHCTLPLSVVQSPNVTRQNLHHPGENCLRIYFGTIPRDQLWHGNPGNLQTGQNFNTISCSIYWSCILYAFRRRVRRTGVNEKYHNCSIFLYSGSYAFCVKNDQHFYLPYVLNMNI